MSPTTRRIALLVLAFLACAARATWAESHAATLRLLGYGTEPIDEVVEAVVRSGSPRLAEELLARIPDVDPWDAARAGDLARLELVLLANPRRLERQPARERRSVLEAAVEGDEPAVVGYVLENELDTENEKAQLDRAIRGNRIAVMEAFCQQERLKPLLATALHDACWQKRTEIAKRMIAADIDVTEARVWGFQAIHAALFRRENELVELLLEKGAEPDVFVAAGLGRLAQMNTLLESGIPGEFGKSVGPHPAFFAARTGQMSTLQPFLADRSVVRRKGHRNFTLLIAASESGTAEVIEALLEAGADRDGTAILWDEKQANALHFAAANGNVAAARVLTKAGIEVDSKTENGTTPLAVAARFGQREMVRELLEKGAAVDAPKSGVETPLYAAAANGHVDVCRLLLEKGAKVDGVNKSPLRIAVTNGHREVAALLLEKGANPLGTLPSTPPENVRVTPLALAAVHPDRGLLERIVESGIDVNRDDPSALVRALRENRTENAKLLLAAGARLLPAELSEGAYRAGRLGVVPVERLHEFGFSINQAGQLSEYLRGAIESDAKAPIQSLTSAGYDVDVPIGARTALSVAASSDARQSLRALLAGGADPRAVLPDGRSVVDVAMNEGSVEAVRILVDAGARPSAGGGTHLVAAAREGDADLVERLLAFGYAIDGPNEMGEPLAAAIENGRFEIARMLLREGARLDVTDAAGRSPLHWAIGTEGVPRALVEEILDQSPAKGPRDHEGLTPLHLAVAGRNEAAVDLLRDSVPDVDLHLAAGLGEIETVRSLVGEDPLLLRKALPPLGEPLGWGVAGGHSEVVRFLIASGGRTKDFEESMTRAVEEGDADLVAFLAEHGVSVNGTAAKYGEPLRRAIHLRRTDLVRALLEQRANPNATLGQSNGWTPLQMAATRGLPEIVKLLLEAGAHVNAEGFNESSALDLALDPAAYAGVGETTGETRGKPADKLEVARILLDAGARARVGKPSKVALAVGYGDSAFVERLLKAGADPHEPHERDGMSPLVVVVDRHSRALASPPNGNNAIPAKEFEQIAKALLAAGADPTQADGQGRTPARFARDKGDRVLETLFQPDGSDE